MTFTYERFTDTHPFYWDTEEGSYFQNSSIELGTTSNLLKNHDRFVTEDNLTSISTYKFDSESDCKKFIQEISKSFPEYREKRLDYIRQHSHTLIASASSAIWPLGDTLVSNYVVSGST
jgi:hypothetical protein